MRKTTASAFVSAAAFVLLALSSRVNAASVGNDPNEAFDLPSDGFTVLSIQLQNPISQTGILDSFTFASGLEPTSTDFHGPFDFHALVFRPTGILNEYSVIFDSGDFDGGLFNGVFTEPITPVAVQPGDLVGHWGRGIAFDINTSGEDTYFNNGSEFNTLLPAGTFLASGPAYTMVGGGGPGTREYGIAFNLVPVPEPSTWALLTIGVISLAAAAVRRRKK